MEEPDEDAVLTAATYVDFRQLHGELDAEAPLRRIAATPSTARLSFSASARRASGSPTGPT
jgi:hypothetical protein